MINIINFTYIIFTFLHDNESELFIINVLSVPLNPQQLKVSSTFVLNSGACFQP